MHRDSTSMPELVGAARTGDAQARERLVSDYLPLVYNVVGRAMDGHADVDDVVQETMFHALESLDGLREPSRFRSWLIAIAMNQIRHRWRAQQYTTPASPEQLDGAADPEPDFVDLTILRLGLSGQRREVAEATRWLDESDRELLALWWQEAAGELTRAELAEAMALTPQHAAVRVQRMKAQLEVGRTVVRALAARPLCDELARTVAGWDGRPAPVWRKRIARHARDCRACSGRSSGLVPAEGLLAGLALLVPLYGAAHFVPGARMAPVASTAPAPGSTGPGSPAPGKARAYAVRGALALVLAVVLAILTVLLWPDPRPQATPAPPAATHVTASAVPPSPSATPVQQPPKASPSPKATPKPVRTTPAVATPEQRLLRLVNSRRGAAGCAPLRMDPRLTAAAVRHAKDMVARDYYDHASPEGQHADARMRAAGYPVGAWAENLDRGTADPAGIVDDWTDGAIHQRNMLDCGYRDTGVAAVPGPDGTVWVQDFAGSMS
ncbi:RNA polymerase subunit sigma [Streptomyces sp. ERV7]|uniref:sigma-70 family RNA polymerase sigma factor n=1 Tax=Streptomyces sp. ERV7 TaxID=1322334 RepID=UPI0007F3BE38|nr:sigma-70 family RNA polymerase sigma factor [Streptomyces sp. ERV7]OAR22197.1 RNA polymerase subunit sigma [Streptomyces sp. ERV7]